MVEMEIQDKNICKPTGNVGTLKYPVKWAINIIIIDVKIDIVNSRLVDLLFSSDNQTVIATGKYMRHTILSIVRISRLFSII